MDSWQTAAARQLSQRVRNLVGEATAKQLTKLRIETVSDLLRHVPRRYIRGTENSNLAEIEPGEEVSLLLEVRDTSIHPTRGGQRWRLRGLLSDGERTIELTFFGNEGLVQYWRSQLGTGKRGLFAGKVSVFRDQLQLTHPDYVTFDSDGRITGGAQRNHGMRQLIGSSGYLGIYPATGKLPTWKVSEIITEYGLPELASLDEPLPAEVLEAVDVVALAEADVEQDGFCARYQLLPEDFTGRHLPTLAEAFTWVHQPPDLVSAFLGRQRMVFDEAFAVQATMAQRRAIARRQPAIPRPHRDDGLAAAFDARLPFELTAGQREVGEQIHQGLTGDHPMQILLQGEVGSGKTLVALRAMLDVVDNGGQAVLLAPTEVLAAQHAATIVDQLGELAAGGGLLAEGPSTQVALLSGSLSAARRRKALLQIASGEAGIIVGTHALLADQVQYADLGLVVVDEQHRFGVAQRAILGDRAEHRPHLLVMTATPIPRTVAMTSFGDLQVATLREIPAGRQDVTTTVVDEWLHPRWLDRAWSLITEQVREGRQAFVVCSQIEGEEQPRVRPESPEEYLKLAGDDQTEREPVDPRGAEPTHAWLSEGPLAGLRLGLVHGRLPAEEKDRVMAEFAAGRLDVLVATTVIEVGVDVPNASVMVISDADRFGISQLHQLRGRIGRGAHPGSCLLLTTSEAGSPARIRLNALAGTRDGFTLAEVDLAQRREGDVLGADQSGGRSSLRLLRVLDHLALIDAAGAAVAQWEEHDPEFAHPGVVDAINQLADSAAADYLERG